jgi:hypothetical protein
MVRKKLKAAGREARLKPFDDPEKGGGKWPRCEG